MRRLGGSVLLACCGTWREEPHRHGLMYTGRAIAGTAAMSTSTSNDADFPAASAARLARAAEIRRRELLLRWLRRLVVPFFSAYGLFLLRPTEGHFLRYVAERRHLDAAFNAWFPPVAAGSMAQLGSKVTPDARALTVTGVPSPSGGAGAQGKASSLPPEAIVTVFRSEGDREWAAKRFKYEKDSEDEERVARKRLLFARDRVYLPDDTVVETIRSRSERLEELRALREHPPMHLLSEQLNSIAEESHRYAAAASARPACSEDAASSVPLGSGAVASSSKHVASRPSRGAMAAVSEPPKVEIHFEDRFLFATAAILFRDCDDRVVRTMRFIGVCGMMWKEVT